jgi:hypothetical protein
MKLLILALSTVIAGFATFLYHHFAETPAILLIPQGYSGDIFIIYDQDNGSREEYEGSSRVYRIPTSGVLFTRFAAENYTSGEKYYYISPSGNRTSLDLLSSGDFNGPGSYIKNPHEPCRTKVAIIDGGGLWSVMSSKNNYEYQHAYAGSYNQFLTFKGLSASDIEHLSKK